MSIMLIFYLQLVSAKSLRFVKNVKLLWRESKELFFNSIAIVKGYNVLLYMPLFPSFNILNCISLKFWLSNSQL